MRAYIHTYHAAKTQKHIKRNTHTHITHTYWQADSGAYIHTYRTTSYIMTYGESGGRAWGEAHKHNMHTHIHTGINVMQTANHPYTYRCILAYMLTSIHTYRQAGNHTYIHTQAYIQRSIHTCVHTHRQTYKHTARHTQHTHIHTYMHADRDTYTHTYTVTNTYTYA